MIANNSAMAFLNSRPSSTAGRVASIQSAGMGSTCFFPSTMKVSKYRGWPAPSAQWQVDFPHRRRVSASEPGRASAGMPSLASRRRLRRFKRAASGPRRGEGRQYYLIVIMQSDSNTKQEPSQMLSQFLSRGAPPRPAVVTPADRSRRPCSFQPAPSSPKLLSTRLSLPLIPVDPALQGQDFVESRIRRPSAHNVGEVRSAAGCRRSPRSVHPE